MQPTNVTPELVLVFFAVFFTAMVLIKLIFSIPRVKYDCGDAE